MPNKKSHHFRAATAALAQVIAAIIVEKPSVLMPSNKVCSISSELRLHRAPDEYEIEPRFPICSRLTCRA